MYIGLGVLFEGGGCGLGNIDIIWTVVVLVVRGGFECYVELVGFDLYGGRR